jgi:hypothetical protein
MLEFSHITWSLSQVIKGGAKEKFVWAKSQQIVFEDLKMSPLFRTRAHAPQCQIEVTFSNPKMIQLLRKNLYRFENVTSIGKS